MQNYVPYAGQQLTPTVGAQHEKRVKVTPHQRTKLECQETDMCYREFEGRAVSCNKYEGTAIKQDAIPSSTSPRDSAVKFFTMGEVAKHNIRGDVWIAVDGKVYDVTKYILCHPGGSSPILAMGGRDATDPFHNYHPAPVYKQLKYYYIGEVLEEEPVSKFVLGHRALRQKFLEDGVFETRTSYYVMIISWILFLFASTIFLTVTANSTIQRVFGALFLAGFFQQIAFLGHDLGHNSVSHKREVDSVIGVIFGPLLSGISMAWWKHTHNIHHVSCNSIDIDPDIQHLPLIGVCPEVISYYRDAFTPTKLMDSFTRWLVGHQDKTFYPLMLIVARYNLYIQSSVLLLGWSEKIPKRKWEILGMLCFFTWMTCLVMSIPTVWERVLFMQISHGLAGVLHIQIVLSHFSMPAYRGQAYNDDTDEWFKMQVKTSLNVDCPWWMDWFHGGLQFQVEHHLWPRIPRHNLRAVQKVTEAYCKQHDIEYTKRPFVEAVMSMKEHLNKVALTIRKMKPEDQPGFFDSMLGEGLSAQG